MYIYHNFFIHSSVDGNLGCFHVLAIANSAAMNHGINVSLSILFSSGYMPRSGIVGSYGGFRTSLVAQMVKRLSTMQETWVRVLGSSPGEGNGNPLQYYSLENPMDRGAWYATVYGVAKSRTRLSNFNFTMVVLFLVF